MLITCPNCGSKSRIATSHIITNQTREAYNQCMNLNCSTVFVTHTTVHHIVEPTGDKPDPKLQPELCKGVDLQQIDIFQGAL